MSSVIEICNVALSRLGNSRTINSLTEQSKEAGVCSLHYEPARDAVLSDFDWNFARKRVALADTGTNPPDWQFAYAYPTDCVRIISIMVPGMRNPPARCRVQYEVGSDNAGTGKLIYTDQDDAWLMYTGLVTDPNMYDAIFRDALAWRMAAEMAMSLTSAPQMGQNAMTMYAQIVRSAGSHSMNESQEPQEPQSEFTAARLS